MRRKYITFITLLFFFSAGLSVGWAGSDETIPGYPDVIGEYVSVPSYVALGTPSELNTVNFLRVRSNSDCAFGNYADAVVIAQPGFASTPGGWLEFAAQLVTKAANRQGGLLGFRVARVEVWIIDRRGSNLEDTTGLRQARAFNNPEIGMQYYYGLNEAALYSLTPNGTFPLPPDGNPDSLLGMSPYAMFTPLTQDDVPFMAEWGFETAASDVDTLLSLLSPQFVRKNVFIAGHSQGGGFVSNWAGRRNPSLPGFQKYLRGYQRVAGLIFIDGGPSIGTNEYPGDTDITEHTLSVDAIRAGILPRFGATLGTTNIGQGLGVMASVAGLYYYFAPDVETLFPLTVAPSDPFKTCILFGYHIPPEIAPCGGVGLRLTNRAHAGFSFDIDPLPGYDLQDPFIKWLGNSSGRLDAPGLVPPIPPMTTTVYDWLDEDEDGFPIEPSKASAFINNQGFGPSLTNVAPVTIDFAESGSLTIDAGEMNGFTWYQSTRYDLDMSFLGKYQKIQFSQDNVEHDIDKTKISSPVYVISRGPARQNPFECVSDYTVIGADGVYQSETAYSLSPIEDENINTLLYAHSDFMMADDSLAGDVTPGQPGANATTNTLVDWILNRTIFVTKVPDSETLGVENKR